MTKSCVETKLARTKANKNFKELRNRNDLTQEKFAEKIGVSTTTIARIERGECSPSSDTAKKIVEKFSGVTFDWLFNQPNAKYQTEQEKYFANLFDEYKKVEESSCEIKTDSPKAALLKRALSNKAINKKKRQGY
jgi:DNA-binding XRE family transcriptional regulator